ncbi:protease complex subunit PrcB family protein [Flavobacterium plurextorum]|uniref:protease complex subunit PrcB family protein n=1 Tax=Flavobacterium plurextorum TaxID=1114867 RepID=UPI0037575A04
MKKIMLSLFVAFGLSACSLGNEDLTVDCGPIGELPFTGFPLLCTYSVKNLPNNPTALAFNSQEKLETYFTKRENTCPAATNLDIDFTKNFLIGIFAGAKPTSGYDIKITTIVENNCQIIINFYEKSPLAGETLTQTPTYPSDFILIPKTSKTILFNRTNESSDNVIIGDYGITSSNSFFQINDFNILKFLDVKAEKYDFEQYKYSAKTKKDEYTLFLKNVPAEILALKGGTKTYGTPDPADKGGIYFQLTQGAATTTVYIDNNDTPDQNTEIILFKKAVRQKIISLN